MSNGGVSRKLRIAGIIIFCVALVTVAVWMQPPPPEPEAIREFAPGETPPNLIVICIDTLRADHLGWHAYPRPTSPFLDRLARKSAVFKRAYSNSSFTRESVGAIMSGRTPYRGGGYGWTARLASETFNIAHLAREVGLVPAFFSNHPNLRSRDFAKGLGFEKVEHMQDRYNSGTGPRLSREALEWAQAYDGIPYFMYIHYLDPHGPYQPSDDERLAVSDRVYENATPLMKLRREFNDIVARGFGPGDPDFEDMLTRYDGEIRHADQCVRDLLEELDRMGHLENTIVVVLSDHGEEFLEHEYIEHAWTLYPEVLHVPFLISWPGTIAPARIEEPVSLTDLMPTLHTLFGIPADDRSYDGRSLVTFEGEGFTARAHGEPIVSQLLLQERNVIHSIIHEDWQYMVYMKYEPPAVRAELTEQRLDVTKGIAKGDIDPTQIWGEPVREELFNLALDSGAQHDVSTLSPERLSEMRAIFADVRARAQQSAGEHLAPDPDEEVQHPHTLTPEEQEQLDALGYQ